MFDWHPHCSWISKDANWVLRWSEWSIVPLPFGVLWRDESKYNFRDFVYGILSAFYQIKTKRLLEQTFWGIKEKNNKKYFKKKNVHLNHLSVGFFPLQLASFYGFTLNRMIHRNMDSLSIKVDGEKDIILMKNLIQEGFNFWDKNKRRRKKKTFRNLKIQDF